MGVQRPLLLLGQVSECGCGGGGGSVCGGLGCDGRPRTAPFPELCFVGGLWQESAEGGSTPAQVCGFESVLLPAILLPIPPCTLPPTPLCRFKPGYVRGVDLDCLVIGAWYVDSRAGGQQGRGAAGWIACSWLSVGRQAGRHLFCLGSSAALLPASRLAAFTLASHASSCLPRLLPCFPCRGGSGQRRGGAFSQFLLALKDSAAPGCWVSFCKVRSFVGVYGAVVPAGAV